MTKNIYKLYKAFVVLFAFCIFNVQTSSAQQEITVMCYNTLIFPQGNIPNRADTLQVILDYHLPDLLLLQELKSEEGLNQILEVCNRFPNSNYASGKYVSQMSNPSNSWRLQQNIVYNTKKLGLAEESVIVTDYRDINYFKLFIKSNSQSDTIFLHVFNTHLKSSQGSDNEAIRLEMAEVLNDRINALPENSYVIAGGDFNLYRSSEEAYQQLLRSGTNTVFDPIDMPGEWTESSFPDKTVMTQSTRTDNVGNGASGGLDDRFDFMLLSEQLMDQNASLHYSMDSYKALGNNGSCFNQNITDCNIGNELSARQLSALYYMSDHLPVLLTLNTSLVLDDKNVSNIVDFKISPNPFESFIQIKHNDSEHLYYQLFDGIGQLVSSGKLQAKLELGTLKSSLYFLQIFDRDKMVYQQKIIKQ